MDEQNIFPPIDGQDENIISSSEEANGDVSEEISEEVTEDIAETPAEEAKAEERSPAPAPDPAPAYGYSWEASGEKKPKKGGKLVAVIAAVLAFALVLAIGVSAANNGHYGGIEVSDPAGEVSSAPGRPSTPADTSYTEYIKNESAVVVAPSSLTELYETCSPSCLSVITDKALGSGFVVDNDGHIITNHHVISDAKSIKVKFYDGSEYKAKLIGSDSLSDIAVLKIECDDLTPIALGNSDNLKVGESVVAIGTPYDLTLSGTMTPGIISGIARDVSVTNDFGTVVKTMTLIQTSAAINPGNSGGPLIDMAGQVIGITTLKLISDYEGLGFAIPINDAIKIANMLISNGSVTERPGFVTETPRLNITVTNIPDAVVSGYITEADSLKLPEGAMVIQVSKSSAIYKAGLDIYDVITKFGSVDVKSKEDLISALNKYSAGDTVTIQIYRANRRGDGGETKELTFVLESAAGK